MKKAIILTAGIGKRLGNLTKDIPKCLLRIDSENVLLDYSLDALKENNVNEIIFITGFAEEKLKEHINKKWKNKFSFQFIFNDKFADYNNIYSAYLAKDLWDDETVLLNSDIIFHPDILKNLIGACHSHKNGNPVTLKQVDSSWIPASAGMTKSFLVIDDKNKLDEEDMKVIVNENGEIKKINKGLNINESFGEYIGITYLRGNERIKFLESLENNVKNKKLDIYYEDALADILNSSSVFPCSTNSLPWTEVDTEEDYKTAKNIASLIRNPVVV
jgi:choline kinase